MVKSRALTLRCRSSLCWPSCPDLGSAPARLLAAPIRGQPPAATCRATAHSHRAPKKPKQPTDNPSRQPAPQATIPAATHRRHRPTRPNHLRPPTDGHSKAAATTQADRYTEATASAATDEYTETSTTSAADEYAQATSTAAANAYARANQHGRADRDSDDPTTNHSCSNADEYPATADGRFRPRRHQPRPPRRTSARPAAQLTQVSSASGKIDKSGYGATVHCT